MEHEYISETEIPFANKIFSIFFALYPILCIYKGFSRFTVGDIILIVFFIASIFTPLDLDKRLLSVFLFLSYTLFFLLLNVFFSKATNESNDFLSLLFRALKLIFYLLCVLTTGKKYFNFRIFKRSLYLISFLATAFLLFQYFSYYVLGKIILGQVPGLSVYLDEYTKMDYDNFYAYMFRPCSFFLEPAIFCQFMVASLIILLFAEHDTNAHKSILSIVFTTGILLTTSGQGVLYLIIIYIIYLFTSIKNPIKTVFFVIFTSLIAKFSYDKIEAVKMAVDRISNKNATDARFSSYSYCFSLNDIHLFFGYGYGSTANGEYMAGAAYVWYGCGIIGLFLAILMFYSFFKQADNKCSKMICLIFFVMFFGTALFYNYMLYWYFSLMILTTKKYIFSSELQLNNEVSLHSGGVQTESIG